MLLTLLACFPSFEESSGTPLADLNPAAIHVRYEAGYSDERFYLLLRTKPEKDCIPGSGLIARMDGVELDVNYPAPLMGEKSCDYFLWKDGAPTVPRGSGDRHIVITDGRTSLSMKIPAPQLGRRLVPRTPLGGTVRAGERYTFVPFLADVTLLGNGSAHWSPVRGDLGRDPQQWVDNEGLGEVVVPSDLAPGSWRLHVYALANLPSDCPVPECTVWAPIRFTRDVVAE